MEYFLERKYPTLRQDAESQNSLRFRSRYFSEILPESFRFLAEFAEGARVRYLRGRAGGRGSFVHRGVGKRYAIHFDVLG